jgi:hypothetical protein
MNKLTKQWCDEVRATKDDYETSQKLILEKEEKKAFKNKLKAKNAKNQRVHFNSVGSSNIIFESDSSFEDNEINKTPY